MKILIDNGHGVDTPGKRSPDGKLREYAWNRLIAGRNIVWALKIKNPEDKYILRIFLLQINKFDY